MAAKSGAATGTQAARLKPATRPLSRFEFLLPDWLFYAPIVAQWIALGIRHGDFSLPSAANPSIPTGGLCGETKTSALDAVQAEARDWLAPYTTMVTGTDDEARARAAMLAAGLSLPLVVKPDIGCNGTGVRLAETGAALAGTLAAFPRGVALVLQALVPFEGEAGIFYHRHPGEPAGHITSLTLKHAPYVTGDGRSTLRALILTDERAGRVPDLYLPRLARRLDEIPASGARIRLVFAGNHCKGSIFENGADHITPELTARIDAIARATRGFHFGRIDLRFESIAGLRRGEGFRIIEINGVGSEATHIWDAGATLAQAYAAQFAHYATAFRIGAAMRRQGAATCGVLSLYHHWRLQRRLMASYPLND